MVTAPPLAVRGLVVALPPTAEKPAPAPPAPPEPPIDCARMPAAWAPAVVIDPLFCTVTVPAAPLDAPVPPPP